MQEAVIKFRIDHTPPSVNVTGPLTEQVTLGTELPSYKFQVDAVDGSIASEATQRSGVASLVVKVDGTQLDAVNPGCATQSCELHPSYTLKSSNYAPGSHVLKVEAKDVLGHVGVKEVAFQLIKDVKAPTVTAIGKLVESAANSPAGPEAKCEHHRQRRRQRRQIDQAENRR